MKALRFDRFGDPSVLRVEEVPAPEPADGEVLVRVAAAAINPSDAKNVAGAFKTTTLPRTPGRDFAGTVGGDGQGVGGEVWGSAPGLGSTRDGTHAEYVVVSASEQTVRRDRLTRPLAFADHPFRLMHPTAIRASTLVLAAMCLVHSLAAQSPPGSEHNGTAHAAASIPTARGVDHFGVNVPDLEKGIAFFHDVLGADLLWRLPVSGLPGDGMQARYRVDQRSQVGLAMMRVSPNLNIELLEFHLTGQNPAAPPMDQVGAPHLGFYVDDVDAASAWLEQHGCTLLGGPNRMPPGSPCAGQRMRYAVTPLRLVIEVVSRPAHLPYEEKTSARLAGPSPAWTDNGNTVAACRLPTAHNVDHVGLNVPDLQAAIRYCVDVLGAELLWTDGPITDPAGDALRQKYGVDPRDSLSLAMLRCGPNLNLELLEYRRAGGHAVGRLRPGSDVGAGHLAFYVDDIAAAAAYLQGRKGAVVLAGPNLDEGPSSPKRGESHRYFLTPWGASLELVQRPAHLPYESQAAARLTPLPAAWKP